jgi:hypothetical protein
MGMKRLMILLILVSLLLGACSQQATPTATDSEMQTKVAQILTNMPTATGQVPKGGTPAPTLATVVPTVTKAADATKAPATAAATAAPTKAATATIAAPTATAAATNTVQATTAATTAATKAPTSAATSGPTATPVTGDPKTKLGNPTWTDKMNDGDNWPTGTDPTGYTEIDFNNGFMELTGLKPIDGWRLSFDRLSNAYIEMTVNTGSCLPKDRYGLIVRVPSTSEANRGYMVGFTCDGKFAIRKWDGPANSMTNFIAWKANAAIAAGANKTNRLGIMMQGNKLSLYANGALLGEVQDNTWSIGSFGIFAGAHESSKFTLKVDEISYWNLP